MSHAHGAHRQPGHQDRRPRRRRGRGAVRGWGPSGGTAAAARLLGADAWVRVVCVCALLFPAGAPAFLSRFCKPLAVVNTSKWCRLAPGSFARRRPTPCPRARAKPRSTAPSAQLLRAPSAPDARRCCCRHCRARRAAQRPAPSLCAPHPRLPTAAAAAAAARDARRSAQTRRASPAPAARRRCCCCRCRCRCRARRAAQRPAAAQRCAPHPLLPSKRPVVPPHVDAGRHGAGAAAQGGAPRAPQCSTPQVPSLRATPYPCLPQHWAAIYTMAASRSRRVRESCPAGGRKSCCRCRPRAGSGNFFWQTACTAMPGTAWQCPPALPLGVGQRKAARRWKSRPKCCSARHARRSERLRGPAPAMARSAWSRLQMAANAARMRWKGEAGGPVQWECRDTREISHTLVFFLLFLRSATASSGRVRPTPRAPSAPRGQSKSSLLPLPGGPAVQGPRTQWCVAALLRGRRFRRRLARPARRPPGWAARRPPRPAAPRSPAPLAHAPPSPSPLADLVGPSLTSAPVQAPWLRPRPCASAQLRHCPPC